MSNEKQVNQYQTNRCVICIASYSGYNCWRMCVVCRKQYLDTCLDLAYLNMLIGQSFSEAVVNADIFRRQ